MKRIIEKLNSKKGETLVGILVAILIIALSAALFATLYSASMKINLSAREMDEDFYSAVSELEGLVESGNPAEGTAKKENQQVNYTPEGSAADKGNSSSVDVDVYTKDGMSVYKSR